MEDDDDLITVVIDPAPPIFRVDGAMVTLKALLWANEDDQELCAWARSAKIGDAFPALVQCERAA